MASPIATTAIKNPARVISFGEYLLLPYDRKKTELVNGEIQEMTHGSPLHVDIIKFLQKLLDAHIDEIGAALLTLSGAGIEIPRAGETSNVRTPDLIVCDRTQWKAMRHLTKAIFLSGNAPALAIEVASPGNPERDTVDKWQDYALANIPEYWIINPMDSNVLVLALEGNEYRELGEYRGTEMISSKLFPHLEATAASLLDPP